MKPGTHGRGIIAVSVVALLAAAAAIGNQFTMDDAGLIVGTDRLHGLAHWRDILSRPYWPPPFAEDLYRPLTSLLLALQYQLGGGSPGVFRVVSILLYVGASVAVYGLARRLTGPGIALAIGLLFAAHPVHAEAIALAVAQAEHLVAIAGATMVTLYLDRRRRGDGRLSRADWAMLAGLFLVACLSKEHGLVLPGLLVAAEALLLPRAGARRVRTLGSGYVTLALVAIGVLFWRSQVLSGRPFLAAPAEALRDLDIGGRAMTMLAIVPEWLRLLVWPAHLRSDYSPSEFVASTGFGLGEVLGLSILLIAAVVFIRARRRAPGVSFGLAWFAITIFPVSNVLLPTGVLLAERNLFVPSIGFLVALGTGVAWMGTRQPWSRPVWQRGAMLAGLALVTAGVVRSGLRQRVYLDQTTLNTATVEDAPRSARVRQAYAEMLFEQGQPVKGIAAYRKAIELSYEPWMLRIRLAERLRLLGDTESALEELRLSLAEKPTRAGLAQLAAALLAAGKYPEAKRIAEGMIASDHAPPAMVYLKRLADSAIAVNAPPGSIRVGLQID